MIDSIDINKVIEIFEAGESLREIFNDDREKFNLVTDYYLNIINEGKEDYKTFLNYAKANAMLSKMEIADIYFKRGISEATENSKDKGYAYTEYAEFLEAFNRHKEAAENRRKAIEQDRTNVKYFRSLVRTLRDLDRTEEAVEYIEEAKKLDSKDIQTYYLAANVYKELGDLEKSLSNFLYSNELFSGYFEVLLGIAEILTEQEKYEEALPYWEKVKEIAPEDERTLSGLSQMFLYEKNYIKAIECATQAQKPVKITIKFKNEEDRQKSYQQGDDIDSVYESITSKKITVDKGIEILDKIDLVFLKKMGTNIFPYYFTYGRVLSELKGDYEKSLKYLLKAIGYFDNTTAIDRVNLLKTLIWTLGKMECFKESYYFMEILEDKMHFNDNWTKKYRKLLEKELKK